MVVRNLVPFLLAACAGCSGGGEEPRERGLVGCLAAAGDWSAIEPTDQFVSSGQELCAVFDLGGQSLAKLTHVWTAVDVGDAAPAGTEIARSELALGTRRRGVLRYTQEVPLPVGRYRIDLFGESGGGKPLFTRELRVVADPAPLVVDAPAQLLPLVEGVTWEYDFCQTFGPRAKVPEGVTLKDGKLRARVTVKVVGEDADGHHLTFSRDGVLRTEEWWRASSRGLVATRRKVGTTDVVVDPPQLLVPLPPAPRTAWTYDDSQGVLHQRNQAFAPREVVGPEGRVPGIVVVTEDDHAPLRLTAERHFVPGFGLVREVIVQTFDDVLVSRQELTIAPRNGHERATARDADRDTRAGG